MASLLYCGSFNPGETSCEGDVGRSGSSSNTWSNYKRCNVTLSSLESNSKFFFVYRSKCCNSTIVKCCKSFLLIQTVVIDRIPPEDMKISCIFLKFSWNCCVVVNVQLMMIKSSNYQTLNKMSKVVWSLHIIKVAIVILHAEEENGCGFSKEGSDAKRFAKFGQSSTFPPKNWA